MLFHDLGVIKVFELHVKVFDGILTICQVLYSIIEISGLYPTVLNRSINACNMKRSVILAETERGYKRKFFQVNLFLKFFFGEAMPENPNKEKTSAKFCCLNSSLGKYLSGFLWKSLRKDTTNCCYYLNPF